ncbi:protein of unknown function [Agreia sp. COWG]|nr:protein of unknown function [Agreia sp. COWG]
MAANGAWGGYTNGRIPLDALTVIEYPGVNPVGRSMNPMRLEPGCAIAFMALLTRYREDTGSYLPVDEGYRDWDTQNYYYENGIGGAGPPGNSNHGWGKAVDFYQNRVTEGSNYYNWLAANASTFGFTVLRTPPEAWHWNYSGTYTEEDDMTPEQWQRLQDVGTKVSQNADAIASLTASVQTISQYLLLPRTEAGVAGPSTVDNVALTSAKVDRIVAKLGA